MSRIKVILILLIVFDVKVKFHPGSLKMFWTPAPQKFAAPLSLMKETLFPKYEVKILNIFEDYTAFHLISHLIIYTKYKLNSSVSVPISITESVDYRNSCFILI